MTTQQSRKRKAEEPLSYTTNNKRQKLHIKDTDHTISDVSANLSTLQINNDNCNDSEIRPQS